MLLSLLPSILTHCIYVFDIRNVHVLFFDENWRIPYVRCQTTQSRAGAALELVDVH